MANKRDSTSQRRARENRARRAALEARTGGAPPARPSRVAPSTADKLKRTAETKTKTTSASETASATEAGTTRKRGGKPRRERMPRPGDTPVDIATLEGSWVSRIMKVPGGTQALFAGVMAVVATGLMSFTKLLVAEADIGDDDAKATQTVFERYEPGVALPLVVVPLAIALGAVASSFLPQRRRIWLGAAVFLALATVVAPPLQFYLFVAGFFGYAVFRASKVEGPNRSLLTSLRGSRSTKRSEADDPAGEPGAAGTDDS